MTTRFLAALLALALLPGCASITAGTTQSIAVDTQPQRPADCRLSNEKGTWGVRTPGVTTVTKAYGPLTVTCSTPDGWGGSTAVQSTTAGAAFGNIIAGGVIGAAVDMSSGAAYVYPPQVFVPLAQGGYTNTAAMSPPPPPPPPVEPQRGGYRQRSQQATQAAPAPYPQPTYPAYQAYQAYQAPPPGYYYPPPGYQPPPQGYQPPPSSYPAESYQPPAPPPSQPDYRPPSRRTNKPD